MIAAWMLYSLLVGTLLYAAARAAEVVCRALGAPTRFAWALALCATLGLSGNALRSAAGRATAEIPNRSITLDARKGTATTSGIATAPVVAPSRWRAAIQ